MPSDDINFSYGDLLAYQTRAFLDQILGRESRLPAYATLVGGLHTMKMLDAVTRCYHSGGARTAVWDGSTGRYLSVDLLTSLQQETGPSPDQSGGGPIFFPKVENSAFLPCNTESRRWGSVGTVTMEDITRRAGVPWMLVSVAFRDVPGISAATRDHVLTTADAMDYHLNQLTSRLARRAATIFGVFLLDLHQDVYADMFDGTSAVARTNDKHIVMTVEINDGSLDAAALKTLAQSQADTVIATGLLLSDTDVVVFNTQVPLVSVARGVDGVDSTCTNDLRGAQLATRHPLGLGRCRIVLLADPQTDDYLDRRLGHLAVVEDARLVGDVVVSRYSGQQAAVDAHGLLIHDPANRPTVTLTYSNQTTLGVLDAVAKLGLGIPGDVNVVGYDNSQLSRGADMNLTTVDLHDNDLGRNVVELALRRLTNSDIPPETRTNAPSLVVRGTTGPVREAGQAGPRTLLPEAG